MKNLLYIMVGLLILTACDDDCDPVKVPGKTDTVYVPCNAPRNIPGIGYHRPPAHQLQTVSYDYKYLAFKNNANILKVLDLHTNSLNEFDISDLVADNVTILDIEYLDWSPYDNHRVLIQAKTFTDSLEPGTEYTDEWNIYIYDIKTGAMENISPNSWSTHGLTKTLSFATWLPQSVEGKDYILINDDIYFPQEQKYSNNDNVFFWGSEHSISDNGQYFITFIMTDGAGPFVQMYDIKNNHGNIFGEVETYTMQYMRLYKATKISWSPDGKYIALSGLIAQWEKTPVKERSYFEIWVLDFHEIYESAKKNGVVHITDPYSAINLRKEFCMYMFGGTGLYGQMDTEFISDTTMAVSMHEDGAEYSYLYEISIHGEMIRQLTFEP